MLFSELEKAYYIDELGTEYEVDLMKLWRYTIYETVSPYFFTSFVQSTNTFPSYEPGRALLNGSYVGAQLRKPGIVSGWDVVSWGEGAYMSWEGALLTSFGNQGTIEFEWKPEFLGNPTNDVTLFEVSTPELSIKYSTIGEIVVTVAGSTDSALFENLGERIKLKVTFVIDSAPDNKIAIIVDNNVIYEATDFANLDRGDVSQSYISKFIECSTDGEGGRGGNLKLYTQEI